MSKPTLKTLGDLVASGYTSQPIRDELRNNLMARLREGKPVFDGIIGYEDTVIPQIERAILARHSMNLLGLRGQAKTRIARQMTDLLDEYIPVVAGTPLNDDPLNPISSEAKQLIAEHGDQTPIEWLHRSDRYVEKLATPDVSVADLIGDVDPIKAANLKLDYSDERVIHFGLVPRANRCIFVINELPDLQPRIQVALFNILQEGDIQIRGFNLRLALDLQFVFTANPEDYTNRGAIITPLKDRIQAQILTHYPRSIEDARAITQQEARIRPDQAETVRVPELLSILMEQVAFEARESEYVDQKSGISARLTISAFESLISTAELRTLRTKDKTTVARIGDLLGIVPALTGKMELVYEGEQEGPYDVAIQLIGQAIRTHFPQVFPDPEMVRKGKIDNPYQAIIAWFERHQIDLLIADDDATYRAKLDSVDGLSELVDRYIPDAGDDRYVWMELILHGISEFSMISKLVVDSAISFSDLMGNLFRDDDDNEEMG